MSTTGTRFEGTLKKWDVERGFGFVVAEQGGQDVFVHVSAFPRDGHQPIVGEPLSFEMERDRDGRKRAVRVQRPGISQPVTPVRSKNAKERETARRKRPVHANSRTSLSFGTGLIVFLLLSSLGGYAYNQYTRTHERSAPLQAGRVPQDGQSVQPRSSFQCDGRQHCSQMTSCFEAKFFLENCPGVKMDGDNDGIPCEQGLCTGLFGGG